MARTKIKVTLTSAHFAHKAAIQRMISRFETVIKELNDIDEDCPDVAKAHIRMARMYGEAAAQLITAASDESDVIKAINCSDRIATLAEDLIRHVRVIESALLESFDSIMDAKLR